MVQNNNIHLLLSSCAISPCIHHDNTHSHESMAISLTYFIIKWSLLRTVNPVTTVVLRKFYPHSPLMLVNAAPLLVFFIGHLWHLVISSTLDIKWLKKYVWGTHKNTSALIDHKANIALCILLGKYQWKPCFLLIWHKLKIAVSGLPFFNQNWPILKASKTNWLF